MIECKQTQRNFKTNSPNFNQNQKSLNKNYHQKNMNDIYSSMEEFELEEHKNSEIIRKEEFKRSAYKDNKSLKKHISHGRTNSQYASRKKLFTKNSISKIKLPMVVKPSYKNNNDSYKAVDYEDSDSYRQIESFINKSDSSYTDFEINEYQKNNNKTNDKYNQINPHNNCQNNQINNNQGYRNKMNQLHKIIKYSKNRPDYQTKENFNTTLNQQRPIKTENNSPIHNQRKFNYGKQNINTSLHKNTKNQTYNSIYLSNQDQNYKIRNNSSQRSYLKKNKFKASIENNSKLKNTVRNTSMNSNKSGSIKRKIRSRSKKFKIDLGPKLQYPNNYSTRKLNMKGIENQSNNHQVRNLKSSRVFS